MEFAPKRVVPEEIYSELDSYRAYGMVGDKSARSGSHKKSHALEHPEWPFH